MEFIPESGKYKGKPGQERNPRVVVISDGKEIRLPHSFAIIYRSAVKLESEGKTISGPSLAEDTGINHVRVYEAVCRMRNKYGDLWKWDLIYDRAHRGPAHPCHRCGTEKGSLSPKTKKPIRKSGTIFDLDGKICVECYEALLKEQRNTPGEIVRHEQDHKALHDVYQARIDRIRQTKIDRGEVGYRQEVKPFDEKIARVSGDAKRRA